MSTPDDATPRNPARPTEAEVRLREQVDRLEQAVVTTLGAIASLLLLIGATFPLLTAGPSQSRHHSRLWNAGFAAFGSSADDPPGTPHGGVAGVVFLATLLLVLLAVAVTIVQHGREVRRGWFLVANATAPLLLVGTIVVTTWCQRAAHDSLAGTRDRDPATGPDLLVLGGAGWLLIAGAVVFCVSAWARAVRELWADPTAFTPPTPPIPPVGGNGFPSVRW